MTIKRQTTTIMECAPYIKTASVFVTIIIVSWLVMNFAKTPSMPSAALQKQQKRTKNKQQGPRVAIQNEANTELDVRKNDRAALYFDYGERDMSLSKKLRNLQQSAARVVSSKMMEMPMINREVYFNK